MINTNFFITRLDLVEETNQDLAGFGIAYTNSLGEKGHDRIALGAFQESKDGVVVDSEQNLLYLSVASRRYFSVFERDLKESGCFEMKTSLKLNARGLFGQVVESRQGREDREGVVMDSDFDFSVGGIMSYEAEKEKLQN